MGYLIKEAREKAHMTQEELALKSGVSRVTIVSLEREEAPVTTTKTLAKLAKALNTSVSNLFFD